MPIDVTVPANVPWTDTGVLVERGKEIRITYMSGTWTCNPGSSPGYDANGFDGLPAKQGYVVPGANEGGLVGKVGERTFWIGRSGVVPDVGPGNLLLGINDDQRGEYGRGYVDNQGTLTVRIVKAPPTVQQCTHCTSFLGADALLETDRVKVTRCIFTSSLYIISKHHLESDTLEVGIEHLHHTVQIAQALINGGLSILNLPSDFWRDNITHVVMHLGPTKKKPGNNYEGYEHFHSFIVLVPNPSTHDHFQTRPPVQWAKNTAVATGLWGDVSEIKYAPDSYHQAIEYLYQNKAWVKGTTPVYFSIELVKGVPTITRFSI
jgi:hypothetical protein